MSDVKAEEIISILYAIFGFIVMQGGYEKSGYAFMVYAAINMCYVIYLAIKEEIIKRQGAEAESE